VLGRRRTEFDLHLLESLPQAGPARRGHRRSASCLRCARSALLQTPASPSGRQVSRGSPQTGRVDRGQRPGRSGGLQSATRAPTTPADQQLARPTEPRVQTPNPRGDPLPQRSRSTVTRQRHPLRSHRRMGNRKSLSQTGTRVTAFSRCPLTEKVSLNRFALIVRQNCLPCDVQPGGQRTVTPLLQSSRPPKLNRRCDWADRCAISAELAIA